MDYALKEIGQAPLPIDCCLMTLGSWMGGDRDGNPYVTAKLTKRVVHLSKWRAANLYWIEVRILSRFIASCVKPRFHSQVERFRV